MENEKNKLEAELGRQLESEAAVAKEYSGKVASQAGDEPELF